jgi:DMSO/TMAO reductase YedYZ molybdopterin-dependent catalytic subunit
MKITALIFLVSLVITGMGVFAGCSAEADTQELLWAITVENESGESIDFTNADAAVMDTVNIEAVKEKKDGSRTEQDWEGIPVSEVLKKAGFNDYGIVLFEASDGYSKEFDRETIDDSGTILGLRLDGEELDEEDGPVQLVISSESAGSWIKNVTKIVIIE